MARGGESPYSLPAHLATVRYRALFAQHEDRPPMSTRDVKSDRHIYAINARREYGTEDIDHRTLRSRTPGP